MELSPRGVSLIGWLRPTARRRLGKTDNSSNEDFSICRFNHDALEYTYNQRKGEIGHLMGKKRPTFFRDVRQ